MTRFTATESGEAVRVGSEATRQDLDRDVASEVGVARAIHLTHAAFANLCRDHIRPQRVTDSDPPADINIERHGRGTQERGSTVVC